MNDQERLWAGSFGDAYHQRNTQKNRFEFWIQAIGSVCFDINSVLELGAGQGDNLAALRTLIPHGTFSGLDINLSACETMKSRGLTAYNGTAKALTGLGPSYDLTLTRGLLIHIPEEDLADVFNVLYNASKRYICIAEYFSPHRRVVSYRGYTEALWVDDFAGKMMEQYNNLKLVDYGFVYHADGGEDLTWFLLRK